MSFAVERLGDLLIEEATFLHGVTDKVSEVQVELRRMKCFLKDADARQGEGETIRNWVAEIRENALDAEGRHHRHFCPQSCLEEEKGFSKHPQEVCLHLFRVDCSPQGWDRD